MKTIFGLLAALTLLGGCQSSYPDSPLSAATPAEARCAAIRSAVPLGERGTSADPTAARHSDCASAPRYERIGEDGGINSRLYPFRTVWDAAIY